MELDVAGLVLPQRIETVERSEDGRAAEFLMTPLERGYGHTLGNTVRRILLSSLRGAAVWGFRMDGVLHEHQTVEGVVEDMHQVIQNLKTLVLALDESKDEATLEFRVEKAGPVTARAIEKTGAVTIRNPDHHLFTLEDDRELNVTLYVDKGRGFVPADTHSLRRTDAEGTEKEMPVDVVRIDSIYNPVLRANFTVEETRVGQRTDFDRLTFLVETNGSTAPEDAMAYAAELARKHFEYLLNFGQEEEPAPPVAGAEPVPQRMRDLFDRKLEDLPDLSTRSANTLKNQDIVYLSQLVALSEAEALKLPHIGDKTLEEIKDFLSGHNLHFGMVLEEGEDGSLYVVDRARLEAESGEEGAAATAGATAEEEKAEA